MYITPEQIQSAGKVGVDAFLAAATLQLNAIERFSSLNVTALKSAFDDSVSSTRAIAEAKDVQEVVNLQAKLAGPAIEKAIAYSKNVYDLAKDARNGLSTFAEKQVSGWNSNVIGLLEQATKNAPVGSETAMSAMKSFVAATTGAYDNIAKIAKQATEIAEANVAATTETVKGLAKTNAAKAQANTAKARR